MHPVPAFPFPRSASMRKKGISRANIPRQEKEQKKKKKKRREKEKGITGYDNITE